MNITKLDIELDKHGCIYEPGEEVSGQVLMRLENRQSVRGLKIKMEGKCHVQWERKETVGDQNGYTKTELETVTATEHYIDRTEYLIGRENGRKIKIPAGKQSYLFSLKLPRKIPSSFHHDYGNVIYTLKAVVDRHNRADHEVTKEFTVVPKLDLNTVPEAMKGIHDEHSVSFSNLCCYSLGEMDVRITLPASGYVPGQNIKAKVYFDNRSKVEIQEIKMDFIQMITFKVPRDSEQKIENKILENETLYGPFDESGEFDMSILVRSVPASYFYNCELIDIDYELNITYVTSDCHSDISNNYPIFIGTIPLISAPSDWSTASIPVEATAASAPYLAEPEVPIAPYPPGPEVPIAPYPPGPEVPIAPYPPGPEVPFAPYPPGPEVPIAPYPPGPEVPIAPYPPGPEVPIAPYPPGPEVPFAPYPPGPEVPIAPYPPGPEVPIAPYPPGPEVPIAPYPPGPEVPIAPYPPGPAYPPMPMNYQPMPENYKLGFENYKPGAGEPVTRMPFVVPVPGSSTLPIGFVIPSELPPPSYEECTRESQPVDQKQEPNSGADVKQPLIPPYPLDNLPYKNN